MNIEIIVKVVFFLLLALFFIGLFGYESIKKFYQGEITTVESVEKNKVGNQFPAVTVCANLNGGYGWKNWTMDEELANILGRVCQGKNATDIFECVLQRTYTIDEVIDLKNGTFGMEWKFWESTLKVPVWGVCHTYLNPVRLCIDFNDNCQAGVYIHLFPQFSYEIFLHDPDYFLLSANPLSFPHTKVDVSSFAESENVGWFYMDVTKHVKLSTSTRPCSSSFSACVKEALAAKIGCHVPFMSNRDDDDNRQDTCSTLDQLKDYEKFFMNLSSNTEHAMEVTGCNAPCVYKEYRLVGSPIGGIYRTFIMFLLILSFLLLQSSYNYNKLYYGYA